MTVLCAQCQTENRDRAMFCIGCAGKLPAFAATGPSALQALGGAAGRPAKRATPAASGTRGGATAAAVAAPRGLLIAVLLLGLTVLALVAWIGFGPSRAPASPPPAPVAASAPAPAPQVAPAPLPQMPVEATLAAGESTVPVPQSVPVALPSPPQPARSEPPQRDQRRDTAVALAAPARGAADPRTGCEQMFFVLAARCEAKHCEEAAYARHPRCTIVRAQRERDVARRDLSP